MITQSLRTTAFCVYFTLTSLTFGQSPQDSPRPIPLTRPDMKRLLESVKIRTPRIPLPELTDDDRQQLGDQVTSYEARLRYHYLDRGDPAAASQGFSNRRGGRTQDPNMTLEDGFKVELFWIVSRVNNCQYCLGHQESKLLGAGRSENRIAALDGDWQDFTPTERAAYAFARKYTYQPHLLNNQDINSLKTYFTDAQIVEMMLSMAWNNSINRWKEGVGVPQNPDEGGYSRMSRIVNPQANSETDLQKFPRGSYLTPTDEAFQSRITQVAPISRDKITGEPTTAVVCERPDLESSIEVAERLEACRQRQSRLALVDPENTRKLMGLEADQHAAIPNWLRLMAHFPLEGVRRAQGLLEADSNTDLDPLLKAQLSWIVARNDRAWYAVGQAQKRLRELGQADEQIFALDNDWQRFSPGAQAIFRVAKNLAASPVVLTDVEIEEAVQLVGPATVVQTVNYVSQRAAFDRLTEAAGLPLE